MTLFNQIALLVSVVFFIFVLATTIGDFRRSSEFLEGQLQTSAQDMATTLGISISNSGASQDKASLEVLFNSVFDSGYYTRIELVDTAGRIVHKKEQKISIRKVPDWFVSLVPLKEATGASRIQQGWTPVGDLSITVHPGFTYVSLYKSLQVTILWAVLLFVAGMVLLWFLLRKIMQPLDKVKNQAEAIQANQFVQQEKLPSTPELRRVVEAMNNMVAKVQGIFVEQQHTLSRYQDLLYVDSLTGLGNHKYIVNQLEQSQSEDAISYATMAILKLQGLEALRDSKGYESVDNIICLAATQLGDHCITDADEKCARLNEDEFAILVCAEPDIVKQRITKLFGKFRDKSKQYSDSHHVTLIAGVTRLQAGSSTGEMLADADFALTQALGKSPYSIFETTRSNLNLPQGKMQWRTWIENALLEKRLYLASQAVLDVDGNIVQKEVFVRVKNEEQVTIPAGMFMPMALSLGFGLEIDRAVFKLVSKVSNVDPETPVALNLTASFFDSHCHISQEFTDLLAKFIGTPNELCLEASHAVFNQYPSMCMQVADRLRELGHQFGIDNFDLKESLGVLQSIRPSYIKVNANMLIDLTPEDVSVAFQALKTLVKTLDIKIIAVGVSTQEIYDRLIELGIETMQGHLLAEPQDLL